MSHVLRSLVYLGHSVMFLVQSLIWFSKLYLWAAAVAQWHVISSHSWDPGLGPQHDQVVSLLLQWKSQFCFFSPLSSGITSWTQYPLPKGPPWPPWSPSPHSPNSYIISDQPMIFPFFNILDNNDFGEIYFFFLLDWLVCKVAVLVWVEICFPD